VRLAFLADASLPHTQRWVRHFAGRGHDCLLVSLEPGAEIAGVHTLRLHDRPALPRFLRYTLELPRVTAALRTFAPDVVNAHFVPNYGWLAVRAGAHPLVTTVLGSDVLTVPRRGWLRRWRTAHVLQRSDAVTSDAQMLTAAVQAFGVAADRILTVPFGIEAVRFATLPQRTAAPIVALSTRRLEPVYDIGTLLDAWARLDAATRSGMRLRIAGDGSDAGALRARGAPLGVDFIGWLSQADLDRELAAAHLYVSTSRSDSTSVSLLEAMAAGCFPIVSDLEANREWVEPPATALLFPPGDAAALAVALRRAADDAPLRAAAAVRNRATVRERATWETNMAAVEALFVRLAGG
jgi:glycosyltransferase involved in cell wall biosynthesis